MKYKNCCFTGHRQAALTEPLKKRLTDGLRGLITEYNTHDFYAGGAAGWDMLCEETVLKLREEFPFIRLHLVLPCSAEEQTARWDEALRMRYYDILKRADTAEYVSLMYTKDCMKLRNARLVEYSDCCVCYYDKNGSVRSGTGQTIRMAESKGIRIFNLFS